MEAEMGLWEEQTGPKNTSKKQEEATQGKEGDPQMCGEGGQGGQIKTRYDNVDVNNETKPMTLCLNQKVKVIHFSFPKEKPQTCPFGLYLGFGQISSLAYGE